MSLTSEVLCESTSLTVASDNVLSATPSYQLMTRPARYGGSAHSRVSRWPTVRDLFVHLEGQTAWETILRTASAALMQGHGRRTGDLQLHMHPPRAVPARVLCRPAAASSAKNAIIKLVARQRRSSKDRIRARCVGGYGRVHPASSGCALRDVARSDHERLGRTSIPRKTCVLAPY